MIEMLNTLTEIFDWYCIMSLKCLSAELTYFFRLSLSKTETFKLSRSSLKDVYIYI